MKRGVITATVSAEELRAAYARDLEDRCAVLFFLVQAERENLMLNGRTAHEAFEAAGRLLGYTQEGLAKVREIAP